MGEEDTGARFFGIEIRVEHRVGFIKESVSRDGCREEFLQILNGTQERFTRVGDVIDEQDIFSFNLFAEFTCDVHFPLLLYICIALDGDRRNGFCQEIREDEAD